MLIAIDPAATGGTGIALFSNGRLVRAISHKADNVNFALIEVPSMIRSMRPPPAGIRTEKLFNDRFELVIEYPMIYPTERQKGDPNDLISIALVAGAASQAIPGARITMLRPHEWKGQLPKGVMHARIIERLDPVELGIFDSAKDHNAKDAIGIGLHALGRLR